MEGQRKSVSEHSNASIFAADASNRPRAAQKAEAWKCYDGVADPQKRTRSFANILLPLGWLGFIAWLMLHAIRANVLYALERQKFGPGGEKY